MTFEQLIGELVRLAASANRSHLLAMKPQARKDHLKGRTRPLRKSSTQADRVRQTESEITYDVEIDGAMQLKELPFVAGVMVTSR